MKKMKSKTMAILFATILTFSMTASLITNVNALAPGKINIATYGYCAVSPNPVGVGQTIDVNFWVDEPPPTASVSFGDRWQNMKVIVTLPDGTTTTLGPFTSDDTGGTHTTFTPTQVGNYTFEFVFPGQILAGNNPPPTGYSTALFPGEIPPAVYIGDFFEPCNATATDTVQQAPISGFPTNPLPTSYWSTPINALNTNWYSIAGPWLGTGQVNFGTTGTYNNTGNYNPDTTAPTTSHIIWTKPVAFGGTAGGSEFTASGSETGNFYSTAQYEPKWQPIIMNDILYLEEYPSSSTNPTGWTAINLQTGQTIWTDNAANYGGGSPEQTALKPNGQVTSLMCGQYLDYVSPNQYGFFGYLWSEGTPAGVNSIGTTFNLFDAMTGDYLMSIVNTSSASAVSNVFPGFTLVDDSQGNLLVYYVNSTAGTQWIDGNAVTTPVGGSLLECWNSTQCILYPSGFLPGVTGANWSWRPAYNGVYNFATGLMWGAQVPYSLDGGNLTIALGIPTGSGGGGISSGVVFMDSVPWAGTFYSVGYEIDAGFSATNGQLLWMKNDTRVPETLLGTGADYYLGDGYYTDYECGALTLSCYSLSTGNLVWAHVLPNARPYDSLGGRGIIANGTIYMTTYGGNVYAYDLATGNLLWQYNTQGGGLESPYAYYSLWVFMEDTVAGGELFVPEGHMYSPPLYKGCQQLALNITNGKVVWSIDAFDTDNAPAIAYGIMTDLNCYDNQIYAYGMGPSKTTVTAPDVAVTTDTPVTITGTVMDISAGASQQAVAANFPNGLPCVSDASMTQFMESVYMQQPEPHNVTGVPVTFTVIDSNGNYRTIGSTTTNGLGDYSFTWKPDITGNYTVYATFAGTQSYYGSTASTGFYVSPPAATLAPAATPLTGLASNNTLMYGLVAIIIVIVIIGAVLAILVTRKHP